jgi:hypothetical protein
VNIDAFVSLIRDELGLEVTSADVGKGFDELPGWDSVLLLSLLTAMERETGQQLSLPDVLEAGNLRQLHALVVAA